VESFFPSSMLIYIVQAASVLAAEKGPSVIDWEAIYGLMKDAIYGGRIDNPYDMRVLDSYLG
jgi:hypothetical protein